MRLGPITCNFSDTRPQGWRIEEPLVEMTPSRGVTAARRTIDMSAVVSRAAARGSLTLPSRRSPSSRRRVAPRGTGARRARTAVVAATGGDDDKDSRGGSEADDIDWKGVFKDSVSEAKRQFMEPLNSPADYVDMMDAPRRKEQRGQKYQEEYGALDPWSSNAFTTYGFIAVGVLLFVFVVVIGPPPDTGGRCSLPWC